MFAAMRSDVESVKTLIAAKVDINAKTKTGETALQRATALEHQEIIDLLQNAGAN